MRELSTEAILARLVQVLGAKNESELARMLDTGSSTISTWKKRDSVPLAICEEVARRQDVSMDWLLYGESPMRRTEGANSRVTEPSASYSAFPLSPREQAILDLFRELDEEAQREVQHAAQEKKRLRDIEQQLKELTSALADGKKPA